MKKHVTALILTVVVGCSVLAATAWLLLTPWGARLAVREAARRTLGAHHVSWVSLDGSFLSGIRVSHLEVRDMPQLPSGNVLRAQAFSIRLRALSFDGVDASIENARFFLHGDTNIRGAEPVILNARLTGRTFRANAYTNSLDLADVREALVKFFDVPPLKGVLRKMDLAAEGRIDHPAVRGRFEVERIVQNEFVLSDVPVVADLYFMRGRSHWGTYGKMDLTGGALRSPAVKVKLKKSRLMFSGRPSRPELDISAEARVARTNIDILIRGTRLNPSVTLSSEPARPKEQLLLMLATGKSWSGMDGAIVGKTMTPELASNFADYLLFGGSRAGIIRFFGLSDISLLINDKKQGVSVSKDVTDRLGVGYGVEVDVPRKGEAQPGSREITQRVQGEYQVTDKITMGLQKEIKPAHRLGGEVGSSKDVASEKNASRPEDDRIYLKYKTAF